MPLCSIHLLALHTTTPNPLQIFLTTLKSTKLSPLVVSRVIRWIILPTSLSTDQLLARNIRWDILLILPNTDPLPEPLQQLVQHQWSITAGVPSRLTQDFATKNQKLLHPQRGTLPVRSGTTDESKTTDSAQDLELSSELSQWIRNFHAKNKIEGAGAVSMLNLLSFKPSLKASYLQYGAAFASTVGSKHGGNAKIVGGVTAVNGCERPREDGTTWDEIALAHYPSILHFADMLADEDYQEVNQKYRVPSLRDTAILMTSEVGIAEGVGEARGKL